MGFKANRSFCDACGRFMSDSDEWRVDCGDIMGSYGEPDSWHEEGHPECFNIKSGSAEGIGPEPHADHGVIQ